MAELILEEDIENVYILKPKRNVELSHYVDNKVLSQHMIVWREACDRAKEAGEDRPRIPEYVGKAILDMAHNLGKRFNFRNYSFLDEMISDAVLHACKYIHNFNPFAKTQSGVPSAFSYINRILWRSFTHRIEHEEKEQYVKNKSFELLGGFDAFRDSDMDEASGIGEEGGSGPTISMIGEELLRRAYEYEGKHGLGSKKKKEEPKEVENNLLLSFMDGQEEAKEDSEEGDDFIDEVMLIIEESYQ